MKKKSLITALALTMFIGVGSAAYAASNTSSSTEVNTANQKVGLKRITNLRGYDYANSVLKNKFGVTDEEITKAKEEGKSMYQIAKDKGIDMNQYKAALIEEKSKAVDEAVKSGKITADEGTALKEKIKNNINSCTGNGGQRQRKNENSKGRGMGKAQKGMGSCISEENNK